jgi:hypothetical protein
VTCAGSPSAHGVGEGDDRGQSSVDCRVDPLGVPLDSRARVRTRLAGGSSSPGGGNSLSCPGRRVLRRGSGIKREGIGPCAQSLARRGVPDRRRNRTILLVRPARSCLTRLSRSSGAYENPNGQNDGTAKYNLENSLQEWRIHVGHVHKRSTSKIRMPRPDRGRMGKALRHSTLTTE